MSYDPLFDAAAKAVDDVLGEVASTCAAGTATTLACRRSYARS